MAEISKQALKVENNTSFPNNNTGAITPADLRAFNVDMIDSLVDELGYNQDSASWNSSIDALEAFTSSQQPAFTALNQFTASQLTINTGVNVFTQSADARLDALESETQNLELFTASVNEISDNGIVQGTSTRLHFYGLVSASIVPNVNGAIASINIEQDGTKLNSSSFNSYTASTNSDLDSIHQTTQSLNNFTASLTTDFVGTASFNAYTQSINSYTSSNDAKVNSLINATASYATSAITASSLVTASFSGNTLTFTKGDSSTFGVVIPDVSGSTINTGSFVTTSSFNAYTSSNDNKVNELINATASYAISSSVAAVDAGQQSQIDALIAATGSYSTSSSDISSLNQFTASQETKDLTLASVTSSLNSATASLFTSASLGLVTASFSGNTLTFTKGDTSTFGVVIPDVSGSTGNFATTGSNTFIGNQTISGSLLISGSEVIVGELTSSRLRVNSATSLGGTLSVAFDTIMRGDLTVESTTPQIKLRDNGAGGFSSGYDLRVDTGSFEIHDDTHNRDVLSDFFDSGSQQHTTSLTSEIIVISGSTSVTLIGNVSASIISASTINGLGDPLAFSTSVDSRLDGLEAATSSYVTSAITASSLVTASVNLNTITFTKGDASTFNITVNTGSGGGGSTDITSLNQFTASQELLNTTFATTGSNTFTGVQNIDNLLYIKENGNPLIYTLFSQDLLSNKLQISQAGASGIQLNGIDLNVGGTFTASLQEGYVWAGGVGNISTLVATSSFAGGGSINTGSFATTGSNNFKGVQSIGSQAGTATGEVYLLGHSGSLVLSNSTQSPTYAALGWMTSSQQNANTNLVFETIATNGSTIVSGSNNIFTAPAAASAGRIYYMENNNIFLNDSGFLPTISSSAVIAGASLPRLRSNMWLGTGPWTINTNSGVTSFSQNTFANNLFLGSSGTTLNLINTTGTIAFSHNLAVQGGAIINAASASGATVATGASGSNSLTMANNFMLGGFIQYNGPISSSLHTINGNSVQGGLNFNLQSGSRQYTVNQNIVNGTLTLNDNIVFSPTLGAANTFTGNNINGTTTINNRASASLAISANNINSWNINNDFDASSVASAFARSLTISGNALFGALQNNLYASGAVGAVSQSKAFSNNLFAGQFISASIVANGTEGNMYGTIGAGNGLNVVGTSRRDASSANGAGATIGSAFFGRYNKEGLGFNTTAEVILAVGTGVSGSTGITRKTGFLIDSGSNTFVEGTLNVSGSSSFTGSVNGNVVSMSLNSQTASMDFSLANYFELTSSGLDMRIELTNVKAGATKTLIISGATGIPTTFSSNVFQPSGSAYTASVTGQTDILSFVAFNNSRVNVVSTLNMI